MRVLVVTQQTIPHAGGLSTHVETLMDALRSRGHSARLVQGGACGASMAGRACRLAMSLGDRDRLTTSSMRAMLRSLQGLVKGQVEALRPSVIHCHDVYASRACLPVAREHAIPVVQTVHGPALYEARMGGVDKRMRSRALIMECETAAYRHADHLIAVDTGQARILLDDYHMADERVTVVLNCVNAEEARRAASTPPTISISGAYFLVPRRLVEKAGVRYAIEAIGLLRQADCGLVVAGDGPLRHELEHLARRLGLAERVRFLGSVPRPALLPLFVRARGVIVPSVPASGVVEATSLAVSEAMAIGTPAIASNIGGLAELIEDGVTGLLVPPGDPQALACAMDAVADDALRLRLTRAAAARIDGGLSGHGWLDKTVAVYERVVAR